jgi:hypothetical protein
MSHENVEWIPLRAATEGAYRGHAGFEKFVTDTTETFETFEPHFELRDLGDRVLAFGLKGKALEAVGLRE